MKFNINMLAYSMLVALLSATSSSYAVESKVSTLLYISPNYYHYSVHLLHPYYDYWFEQGPLVEPIALKALKEKNGELGLCKANETADIVIRIKPNLFYNPQLRVYHSKLVATVFSGGGNVLGTYVGEAQQQGSNSVDTGITKSLNKVYTLAMQDLMTKLQTNALADSTKTNNANTENKLPCGLIGTQMETQINFY